jgi:hypothetical protein
MELRLLSTLSPRVSPIEGLLQTLGVETVKFDAPYRRCRQVSPQRFGHMYIVWNLSQYA